MKQATSRVISNQAINPAYFLTWLDAPDIAAAARPGQFVMARCGEDTLLPRPFSIHQREGGLIALLFQAVGKGTEWLSQCQEGEEIALFGPLGNGFTIDPTSQNTLLVAGGIGIAPLRFMAQETTAKSNNIRLLYGTATTTGDMEELLPQNVDLITTTEDGNAGIKGLVTDLIPAQLDWADQIFACGPLPMYWTMAQMPELKNRPVQVSLEIRMGCGLGVCYGCTVKTTHGLKQVCKDGPVFNLHDVLWDEVAV